MYLLGASVETGFNVHGFLQELHYNPSAGEPPPTMLHCAYTVVGASLPREIFLMQAAKTRGRKSRKMRKLSISLF